MSASEHAIEIREETPLQDDVRALIAELNEAIAEMEPETPGAFNFCLSVEDMATPDTTLWVARRNDAAVGCGALCRHADGTGEVKRMYVRSDQRGAGVAALILQRIETRARQEGLGRLALETGHLYQAAHRLYERAGFQRTDAFGTYPDNPYSIFYAKALGEPALL